MNTEQIRPTNNQVTKIDACPIWFNTKTGSIFKYASFSQCGRLLTLARKSESPVIYDVTASKLLGSKKALNHPLEQTADCIAPHPQWLEFAIGYSDGIHYAERVNLRLKTRWALPLLRTTSIAFSRSGRYLAAGDSEGFISVIDLYAEPNRQEIFYRNVSNTSITALCISEEPFLVTAITGRLPIEVFIDDGKKCLCWQRDLHSKPSWDYYAMTVSTDGQKSAFGGAGGKVLLKTFLHGNAYQLETGLDLVRQLEFMSENNQLLTVGSHAIELWNIWPRYLVNKWEFPKGRILGVRNVPIERKGAIVNKLLVCLERIIGN